MVYDWHWILLNPRKTEEKSAEIAALAEGTCMCEVACAITRISNYLDESSQKFLQTSSAPSRPIHNVWLTVKRPKNPLFGSNFLSDPYLHVRGSTNYLQKKDISLPGDFYKRTVIIARVEILTSTLDSCFCVCLIQSCYCNGDQLAGSQGYHQYQQYDLCFFSSVLTPTFVIEQRYLPLFRWFSLAQRLGTS